MCQSEDGVYPDVHTRRFHHQQQQQPFAAPWRHDPAQVVVCCLETKVAQGFPSEGPTLLDRVTVCNAQESSHGKYLCHHPPAKPCGKRFEPFHVLSAKHIPGALTIIDRPRGFYTPGLGAGCVGCRGFVFLPMKVYCNTCCDWESL